MENQKIGDINEKKCYSCGKEFKCAADLIRHKNRKTPCLIREVAPENRFNPLRCIFCNKIFAQKQTLTRHLGICKIKNGGMDILDEKIQYEQKIRILEEQRNVDRQQIDQMQAQIIQMQEQMKQLVTTPQTINNITNIHNGDVNIINFNNYNAPNVDALRITQDDLLVENITKKLIEMIYFNKELPENHTIYLPNIKEERLLIHKDGSWETARGKDVDKVLVDVKNTAFTTGHEKINGGKLYKTDEEFTKLYPVVQNAIKSFNTGGDHARCEDIDLINLVKAKRNVIAETLRGQRVI